MISQVWFRSCYTPGATLAALQRVTEERYFQAVQTVHVETAAERASVAEIVEEHRLELTYCAARVLGDGGYNLSSIDDSRRRESCAVALRELDRARECGAVRFSLVSGSAPPSPDDRPRALDALTRSLEIIAHAAAKPPAVRPVIEPLDWNSHKRGTLGTVGEAVALIDAVRRNGLDLGLCADTAHMLLNGEDPVGDTIPALPNLAEYHLCNPVLDPRDPQYGDRHLPFGPPGALDEDALPPIIAGLSEGDHLSRGASPGEERRVPLFLEVMNRPGTEDADRYLAAAERLFEYNRRILSDLLGGIS